MKTLHKLALLFLPLLILFTVHPLQATHPPQSPGILKAKEYHAIALFVFTLNERSRADILPTQTPTIVPSETPAAAQAANGSSGWASLGAIVVLLLLVLMILFLMRRLNIT